jgi:hypothetical protein
MNYESKYNSPRRGVKRQMSFSGKSTYQRLKGDVTKLKAAKWKYACKVNKPGNLPGLPFPSRMITTFIYAQTGSLTTTSGVPTIKQFNMNSLYAPEVSGGHQPRYRDQLLGILYNRYRVYKFQYEVDFNTSSNVASAIAFTFPSNAGIPAFASNSDVMEFPLTKYVSLAENGGGHLSRMKGIVYLPKMNGQTTDEYKGDDRFQAIFNASPVETQLFSIGVTAANAADSINTYYAIKIKYFCELFDPIEATGQS